MKPTNSILWKETLLTLVIVMVAAVTLQAQTFDCNSNLYQILGGKDLKVLVPATGEYATVGSSSDSYNGAGFNVEDGYIYGIGQSNNLVRVDVTGASVDLGSISGFSAPRNSGDFDLTGNWYSFGKNSGSWILNRIDVSVTPPAAVELSVTEIATGIAALQVSDISYNPVSQKFYGMNKGLLMEFDHVNFTVKTLADYSDVAEDGGYGAAWSDEAGNSYFFNNNTGNIYRATFDASGNVSNFTFIATSEPKNSNDGMSCALAEAPIFPEICDNGIDDDGDGLIDCEDPDCAAGQSCGIDAVAYSTEVACSESIATYQLFFTNNASISNDITVNTVLPQGQIFIQDTLEFSDTGSSDFINQPVEGNSGTLSWGTLSLAAGETVRIAFDVEFDGTSTYGEAVADIDVTTSLPLTQMFPADLGSSITIGDCPTDQPYGCEPAFYQVYKEKGRGKPNMYGKLNPLTGEYDSIAVASDFANGLGFDINTGMVYGATGKKFVTLDSDGVVKSVGISFNNNVFRGDIDHSSIWYGVDGSDMVLIDVSGTPVVTNTYVGQGLPGWDIAYNQDGHFYSVHSQTLYQFNTTTNQKVTLGSLSGQGIPTSGGYGAQWTGSDGYLYISHNLTGKVIRVDVTTREARVVSLSTDGLQKNDGFSCPDEIPAVFSYDYGDNSTLPAVSIFSFIQDVDEDNVPDFAGAWLGSTVSTEELDPSNTNANGDLDDGVTISSEYFEERTVSAVLGLNCNYEGTINYLVGVDWNDDGQFEEVEVNSRPINGSESVVEEVAVPAGFESGDVNFRVVVSDDDLVASNISGEINGVGEVEDYKVFISEGCTGPDCEVTTGVDGGLESNGSISVAVANRTFSRAKTGFAGGKKSNQMRLATYRRARAFGASLLDRYVPGEGMNGEEATVSSPLDLVGMTNAEDVFAADYYAGDTRKGAALVIRTSGSAYNHSKNVCDRLNGKSIEQVQLINIDGVNAICTAIKSESGATEYSAWYSAQIEASEYNAYSKWNVDMYPTGNYINIQAWSASLPQVVEILRYSVASLSSEKTVVPDVHTDNSIPAVIVQKGEYDHGKMNLTLLNTTGSDDARVNVNYRTTEFTDFDSNQFEIVLSGEGSQEVILNTGYIFDAGLSVSSSSDEMEDALYLADGAWGTDYDESASGITSFEITAHDSTAEAEGYAVERGFHLVGHTEGIINVYRNIKAGERSFDARDYSTMSFDISAGSDVEVVIVPEGMESWEDRHVARVSADEDGHVVLSLADFSGMGSVADLKVKTVVFSYINESGVDEAVDIEVSNLRFSNEEIVYPEAVMSLALYPNPMSGVVSVSFAAKAESTGTVEIVDLSGMTVFTTGVDAQAGSNEVTLELSALNSGVYLLNVELANGQKEVKKLVVK